VRRRLDPDELRALRDDEVRIRRVDEVERETEARAHAGEQPTRAAVEIVAADDVVAGRQRAEERVGRRETGRETEAELPALERRDAVLERVARRVVRARVLVRGLARLLLRV